MPGQNNPSSFARRGASGEKGEIMTSREIAAALRTAGFKDIHFQRQWVGAERSTEAVERLNISAPVDKPEGLDTFHYWWWRVEE